MKHTLILSTALAFAATLWVSISTSTNVVHGQQSHSGSESPARGRLINLDFKGGTAAQYIDELRKAAGEINIVVMGDATAIDVPAIRLNSVDARSAIGVLQSVPRIQGSRGVEIKVTDDNGELPDARPVFIVHTRTMDTGKTTSTPEVVVYDISDLIVDKLKAEDILTAVQASVELLGAPGDPAQFRFHENTGLLIARGTSDQLSAVAQVAQQIRGGLERQAQDVGQQLRNAQSAHAELSKSFDECQQESNLLRQKLVESNTRENALQIQVERMERDLAMTKDRMEQELAKLSLVLRERESQIDALKRDLAAKANQKP